MTSRRGLPPEDHRAHGLRDGLEGMRDLMDRLLGPEGCPWDREQTLDSLRPYLAEEAQEVLDAMHDPESHREELGDLLFQIVFQAALREREGAFDLDGVVESIRSKLIRRHPHVFARRPGDPPATREAIKANWARIKAEEKAARAAAETAEEPPDPGPANPLAGVHRGLPAIRRAWMIQDRAAAVGFDWPDIHGVTDKMREEIEELEAAIESGDRRHAAEELGDLMFVLGRLAQKLEIQPDLALHETTDKFERRFAHVVQRCHEAGHDPNVAGLETLEGFWQEAKRAEPARGPETDRD